MTSSIETKSSSITEHQDYTLTFPYVTIIQNSPNQRTTVRNPTTTSSGSTINSIATTNEASSFISTTTTTCCSSSSSTPFTGESGEHSNNSLLNAGAIAGIIIAALAVLSFILLLIMLFFRRRSSNNGRNLGIGKDNNGPYKEIEEVQNREIPGGGGIAPIYSTTFSNQDENEVIHTFAQDPSYIPRKVNEAFEIPQQRNHLEAGNEFTSDFRIRSISDLPGQVHSTTIVIKDPHSGTVRSRKVSRTISRKAVPQIDLINDSNLIKEPTLKGENSNSTISNRSSRPSTLEQRHTLPIVTQLTNSAVNAIGSADSVMRAIMSSPSGYSPPPTIASFPRRKTYWLGTSGMRMSCSNKGDGKENDEENERLEERQDSDELSLKTSNEAIKISNQSNEYNSQWKVDSNAPESVLNSISDISGNASSSTRPSRPNIATMRVHSHSQVSPTTRIYQPILRRTSGPITLAARRNQKVSELSFDSK